MKLIHSLIRTSLCVFLTGAALPPPLLTAQTSSPPAVAKGGTVSGAADDRIDTVDPSGTKSPVLAGALSALLPGLGSYYAGNSSHGNRHLLIAGAAVAVTVVGLVAWTTNIVEDCLGGDCDSSHNGGDIVAAIGYGVYVGNWFWSIGAAVGDATAYNRDAKSVASIRLQSNTYVQPVLRLSPAVGAPAATAWKFEPRMGIRLVHRF